MGKRVADFRLGKCHNSGVEKGNKLANPTTNYGFVLPTSTDLVTDLPADFDVALQGVDTRLKALQPGTTLGDLAYSSATANTNTRLGIGSTGQVLTVAGGVPAWATAGGGVYSNVLATGTLSGASLDLQSISGSYKDLILEVYNPYVASVGIMLLRFNNESGATNYGHVFMKSNDGSLTAANGTSVSTGVYAAGSNNDTSFARFIIPNYAATTHRKTVYWNGTDTVDNRSYWGTGWRINSSDAINRLTLFVNGQNWSGGTYNLYGVN